MKFTMEKHQKFRLQLFRKLTCKTHVKSLKAALLLKGEGYQKVYELKGGIVAIFSELDEEYGHLMED